MTDTSDSNFLNKLQLEKELYFFTSVDGHSDTRDNKHLLINQSAVSKIKKITKKKKKKTKKMKSGNIRQNIRYLYYFYVEKYQRVFEIVCEEEKTCLNNLFSRDCVVFI